MTDLEKDVPALVEDQDVLDTLRDLMEQLRGADFRDRFGHPLENLQAYMDAKALLVARGLVKEG